MVREAQVFAEMARPAGFDINVVVTPSFFSLRVQDGHLYGSLIDILKNGAPTIFE